MTPTQHEIMRKLSEFLDKHEAKFTQALSILGINQLPEEPNGYMKDNFYDNDKEVLRRMNNV